MADTICCRYEAPEGAALLFLLLLLFFLAALALGEGDTLGDDMT